MKKILTTLLAVMCVFSVMGTAVAADEDYGRGKAAATPGAEGTDGAGQTEVFFNKEQAFEWTIPAKTELVSGDEGYTGSGEIEVTRAMIADGEVLEITIDGGESYIEEGTENLAYGQAEKFNMRLRDSEDSAYNGSYYVSYKIEQVSADSNVGDTTSGLSATLQEGEISKDDVLVSIPAGQAVSNDDGDLVTSVVEALLFTKTGNAAKVGKYSDLLTFTASVEEAQ